MRSVDLLLTQRVVPTGTLARPTSSPAPCRAARKIFFADHVTSTSLVVGRRRQPRDRLQRQAILHRGQGGEGSRAAAAALTAHTAASVSMTTSSTGAGVPSSIVACRFQSQGLLRRPPALSLAAVPCARTPPVGGNPAGPSPTGPAWPGRGRLGRGTCPRLRVLRSRAPQPPGLSLATLGRVRPGFTGRCLVPVVFPVGP